MQGRPGARFIYLTWGEVVEDGSFAMFRRAKLMQNSGKSDGSDESREAWRILSPVPPTAETARLMADVAHALNKIDDDLAEWNYGAYEGLTRRQIREQVPDWLIWTHGGGPGGETIEQVRRRFRRLIDRIEASAADPVICFAHGHALRALMTVWLGLEIGFGANFELDTATVSILIDDDAGRSIQRWNGPVD